jgi:hypothetical protein
MFIKGSLDDLDLPNILPRRFQLDLSLTPMTHVKHYAIPTYKYQNRVIDYHASTMETSEDSIRALLVINSPNRCLV